MSRDDKYPCYGEVNTGYEKFIVHFTEEGVGTVVKSTKGFEVGYATTNWWMLSFTKCKNPIPVSKKIGGKLI